MENGKINHFHRQCSLEFLIFTILIKKECRFNTQNNLMRHSRIVIAFFALNEVFLSTFIVIKRCSLKRSNECVIMLSGFPHLFRKIHDASGFEGSSRMRQTIKSADKEIFFDNLRRQ